MLQLGRLNVLTDPIWSERASPLRWIGPRRLMSPGIDFDALPPIDVVLLSHNHYDHLDAATVRRIAERFPDAAWLCPLGLASLLQTFGVRHAIERDWWQSIDTPAFCRDLRAGPALQLARARAIAATRLWCGWSIAADGVRVYFGGDTGLHPEFGTIGARLGPFDLVMLPIGAYEPRWFMRTVHLDPQDAIAAYRALTQGGARSALPGAALGHLPPDRRAVRRAAGAVRAAMARGRITRERQLDAGAWRDAADWRRPRVGEPNLTFAESHSGIIISTMRPTISVSSRISRARQMIRRYDNGFQARTSSSTRFASGDLSSSPM